MAAFEINKGVGRTVEFKGLKAQYLFLFAGGLLAVFILVVVLYLCGVSQIACLVIGVVGATVVVWHSRATSLHSVVDTCCPRKSPTRMK